VISSSPRVANLSGDGWLAPRQTLTYGQPLDSAFALDDFLDGDQTYADASPTDFVRFAIKVRVVKKDQPPRLENFTFDERRYLRQIYNTPSRRVMMMCGRQVEKCGAKYAELLSSSGKPITMGDVQVGDRLLGLSSDGAHTETGTVTWKSAELMKPCVKIRTRQGHETVVALTHPMRSWGRWEEAGTLDEKEKLATVRKGGEFSGESNHLSDEEIMVAAYMVAEGYSPDDSYCTFTQNEDGPVLWEFLELMEDLGWEFTPKERKVNNWSLRFSSTSYLLSLMKSWGLHGKLSADKFVPDFVYGLDRRQTALFLNRLWAGDGHCSLQGSSYHLEYDSISERLVRDVQRLLWKFGIPTSFRRWKPTLYKGTDKWAYKLRVETAEGVRRFLTGIGALGKTEGMPLPPEEDENNNRDTYPAQIQEDISAIIEGRRVATGQRMPRPSLRSVDLRETLKHPPSRSKLQQYVDHFRSMPEYPQGLVETLATHLDTDLFWDEIVEIEDMGEQPCYDITVAGTDSFVADGFITHNSTSLGNIVLAYSCILPGFNSLFVSPSRDQTRTFSRDRLREPMETSPVLRAWSDLALSDSIERKQFVNRSVVTLRYAYHNADRTRGIPADLIVLDEIQDIYIDHIPVILECASHSPYKIYRFSGTPKSVDNTIEYYWSKESTQNEWVVPCERHGTPKDPGSWHWNVLGERNIQKHGLSCERCCKPIQPMHPRSTWAAMNPSVADKMSEPFEGFRIPQLMVPWIRWNEILDKYGSYGKAQFYNEVLGMSYDSGTRPLTQRDLTDNCDPQVSMHDGDFLRELKRVVDHRITPIYAGIDWGCHDDQTRILTERGFKYFRDVLPDDRVAQFDEQTREMSFVVPEALTVRDWDEPLHHYTSRAGVDMMLTGTHRMLVKGEGATQWKVEKCAETSLRSGGVKFRGSVEWGGQEQETFTLPGQSSSPGYKGCDPRTFSMDDWLEFMGYLVSEGGVCRRPSRSVAGLLLPYCIKMSQRASVNPKAAVKIKACMKRLGVRYQENPNAETGDLNWSICEKQFWHWMAAEIGEQGHLKRLPRWVFSLSSRQLQILFDAMMLGDGNTDPREGNFNGYYSSTSKGLCEDFQEICIRVRRRSTLSPHKPAHENKKAQWRVSWSAGKDQYIKSPKTSVRRVPYRGKVYCCKVPSGFIVTERNGRIAYQGNTGEQSYTVLTLGAYLDNRFTIFYMHRFTGVETEPDVQLRLIKELCRSWRVRLIGCDYGGGFFQNDALTRAFGPERVHKYQYLAPLKKVSYEDHLRRWIVNRQEVMSDIFNAIKRRTVFRFPKWEEWEDPYSKDCLSIFSEYNEKRRCDEYKKSPGATDDTFHSILYCFLVSMLERPRPDVIAPRKEAA